MNNYRATLLAAVVIAGLPSSVLAQERPERPDTWRGERSQDQRQRDDSQRPAFERPQAAPPQASAPRPDRPRDDARNRPDRPQGFAGGAAPGDRNAIRPDEQRDRAFRTDPYRGGPGGPGAFAGDNRRAGGDWRRDSRYDWRGYRDSHRAQFRGPRYVAPRGWSYGYRRFAIGAALPSFLFAQNYWIGDPWSYRLPPAYGPYRWVRYYGDVLLIDLRSGRVVDMIPDFFW